MGETRLKEGRRAGVLVAIALAFAPRPAVAAPSRFASYDNEADCVGAGTFPAAVCHIAFANARSEYESKTPSFPTEALCARRFPSCMPWPPGADARKASYRPRWDGVDIVDTPKERSVTPAPGGTGRAVRFASRPLEAEPRALDIRGAPLPPGHAGPNQPAAGRPGPTSPVVRAGSERALPPSAPPPPGSGFKLEDGVLTYPAPERFQPKNLPKSPD